MVRYNGPLGRFSYDDEQFRMRTDEDGKQCLEYIGTETDGSKIQIPEGILDATGMFQDKQIASQPVLPDSIAVANCMFAGCDRLEKGGALPKSLESADYMYAECHGLVSVKPLPDGLVSAQGMFDGCRSLEEIPNFPASLVNAKHMFMGCPYVESSYELPPGMSHEDVYGHAVEDGPVDDLSDLPDTKDLSELENKGLSDLFSQAEMDSGDKRPDYESLGIQASTEADAEEQKMSQKEREQLLESLDISGLEGFQPAVPSLDVP